MPIAKNEETGEFAFLADSGQWLPARTAVNPETGAQVVFDGRSWVTPPEPDRGVLGTLDDLARSIARGVTFGASDVIAARVNPAINRALGLSAPETTEEALAEERRRTAAVDPVLRTAGEIGGAIGSTVLAAPAVGLAAARAGITALPRAVQFGALGATEAGVQGAFDAPAGEELEGALRAAPIGALVGSAAPGVAQGVANFFGRVRNAMSPEASTAARLGRAMVRDVDTPATLQTRAETAALDRPGTATIADVGGENVRGLVERIAQTPGAGVQRIKPRLEGRQRRQAMRLGADLQQLTGTGRSAFQAINETMARRMADATPLYRAAYAEGDRAIRSPELDRLMSSDLVVSAMKRAISSGRDRAVREGLGAFNPRFRVTDDGRILPRRGAGGQLTYPNLQFWDQVKRELDTMGQQVTGPVGQQVPTERAQNARGLARALRTELDRLTTDPETGRSLYSAARNVWSNEANYLDALEAGRRILRRDMSAEEMAATFNAMSRAEQEAFRTGAVSALIGRMGNDPSKFGDMTKFIRSPEVRGKISAIMPNQEAAAAWARRLGFEERASELTGQALRGSPTARRLAQREDDEDLMSDLLMDALSGAGSTSILRRVLTAGPVWLRDTVRSRADAELADVLTNPSRIGELDAILARAARQEEPVSGVSSAISTALGTEALLGAGGA